ncbi:MOSC domain-containing protein [Oceanobacillus sp. Castelsardo]|uniref:MOSC domain-containing protein n=1 Tax=Oceanobacillus sp. Castelsardo TaxID=1851204 RepID=UPI000837CB5F|nr:MOSC domain-containing protein [Oceanobacillus sp. Castelsardo]
MEEPYVFKIFSNERKEKKKRFRLLETGFSKDKIKDEAIFAYPIKHYSELEEGERADNIGMMEENFSVLEMDEFTVSVGDTFRMGEAIIQVSQPGKIRRVGKKVNFQTGWYFRVIEEGKIKERTDLELLDRAYPQWSITACNEIMFIKKHDLRRADELYECELLSEKWRHVLRKRVRGY